MSIPWITALQLARKLLPVVIEKAPELLKTFERFRVGPSTPDGTPADADLAALQKEIETHQRTIATQAETIAQLRSTLSATKRAATRAWIVFAAAMLFSLTMMVYLLFRS